MSSDLRGNRWLGYGAAVIGIASANGLLKLWGARINPTTVALTFLLVILFVATAWGSRPAVLASLVGIVSFNFFFLPPFGTLTIRDPDNWIAFIAFMITALTAGQLSARAKRRAEEAEEAKREIERLYHELQDTFERSSQAKALKQSERLKTALLDAVTHDLRTPLTSIKASVTTLLDDLYAQSLREPTTPLGDEGRKEMLEVINEESDRLDRFIEGLTKLARIDAGEIQLRRQWSSIDEVLTVALKRAEPKVAPGANETMRLSVEDEGPGISAETRERVFDKFFRAMRDGDVGDHKSGSGMGLAIARGIVEAHGGRIWIEDADGHPGAKFVVELPTGDDEGSIR